MVQARLCFAGPHLHLVRLLYGLLLLLVLDGPADLQRDNVLVPSGAVSLLLGSGQPLSFCLKQEKPQPLCT